MNWMRSRLYPEKGLRFMKQKLQLNSRMIHGLRDANYKQGQEQVYRVHVERKWVEKHCRWSLLQLLQSIVWNHEGNHAWNREEDRLVKSKRERGQAKYGFIPCRLYSDIFPSVIESPHIQLDSPTQFTKLRDVVPSSIEQKPANGMNPNSNRWENRDHLPINSR